MFAVLHDESDDLDVRLAAVRAVGRSAGAINQLVRRFQPAPVREAAVGELARIARSPLPEYAERRMLEDMAAVRTDPLGPQLVNLGADLVRPNRLRRSEVGAHPCAEGRYDAIVSAEMRSPSRVNK